jgi:hypothetical protein
VAGIFGLAAERTGLLLRASARATADDFGFLAVLRFVDFAGASTELYASVIAETVARRIFRVVFARARLKGSNI